MDSYFYELVTRTSKEVLQQVLEWGTPRRGKNQTFMEYLKDVKELRGKDIKTFINSTERKQLTSEKIDSFDISLLCKCIQYGCDGLINPKEESWKKSEGTLEYYVIKLTDLRNDFVHGEFSIDKDKDFFDKVEELKILLNNIFKKSAVMYNVDVSPIVQKLNKEIDNIRNIPLLKTDKIKFSYIEECRLVYKTGRLELKKKYHEMSVFGPVTNLLHRNLRVNIRVDKIFTKMLIKEESDNSSEYVDYENLLLCVKKKQEQRDNVILLVEGPAGAGKTTLTRKIISDWASERSSMEKLRNFEMAILTECRNSDISSLKDLLSFLMPEVSNMLPGKDLTEYLHGRCLLFIVDGLDELNSSSELVLQQIMKLGKTTGLTVICTTRPNRVRDFKRYVPENFAIMHMKVIGIDENKREEFVRNYSKALDGEGEKDISGLIQYLTRKESRLQDHWKLAFNLVLVTILWFLDPNAINKMTTATELFITMHELCQKKLKQRLFEHEKTRELDSGKISERVDTFLKNFSREALNNHYRDDTILSTPSVERLKDVCQNLHLPHAEVLGSFLIQTPSIISESKDKYSFPHKGLQDFLSALHIKECLISHDMDIPSILRSIRTTLLHCNVPTNTSKHILAVNKEKLQELEWNASDSSLTIHSVLDKTVKEAKKSDANEQNVAKLDLMKCQNIFIHLAGLLYHRGKSLNEDRCKELVALLNSSGIKDRSDWLSLLSEIKCDERVSKYIAQAMDLRERIEITDSQVRAYIGVLRHTKPSHVEVDIASDPQDVPRLKELLSILQAKNWKVDLRFRHDFRYMKGRASDLDESLQDYFQRSKAKLTWFNGWLSGLATKALPSCLQYLELAVKDDDHYRELLPHLSSFLKKLPRLEWLGLHIAAGIDTTLLKPLPKVNRLSLTIDNVTQETVEWACQVASALRPSAKREYFYLAFPDVLKSVDTCELLVGKLALDGVRVSGAIRTSPRVSEDDRIRLDDLTHEKLGCFFEILGDDIWHQKLEDVLRNLNRRRHEEYFV